MRAPALRQLIFASLALLPLTDCVCAPTRAGDACVLESDDDGAPPCPQGTACQATPDGAACFVQLGGACDEDAADPFCADGSACKGAVCGGRGAACRLEADDGADACADGLECAENVEEKGACQPPLVVSGSVHDAKSGDAIPNADVIVLDESGAAIGRRAHTDEDGRFRARVDAARTKDGTPLAARVSIVASAPDYEPYPGALRRPVLLDLATASETDDAAFAVDGATTAAFVLETADTALTLAPLPAPARGRRSVRGTVASGAAAREGLLVVAEGGSAPAPYAFTDVDGTFAIHNVAAGTFTLRAYAGGVQIAPKDVTVAGEDTVGVVLSPREEIGATVTGAWDVDDADPIEVDVVLVPASVVPPGFARGPAPRGLRARGIDTVTFAGVPDGAYLAFASLDDDGLVQRDVCCIPLVDVPAEGALEPFVLARAITLVSPGAHASELVDNPATFTFTAAQDGAHAIVVLDPFGATVATRTLAVDPGEVGEPVSLTLAEDLDPGLYQWLVISPTTLSEQLSGIFTVTR